MAVLLAAQTMPLRKTNDSAALVPASSKQSSTMLQMMGAARGGDIKIDFVHAARSTSCTPAGLAKPLQLQDQADSQESAVSTVEAPLQLECRAASQESAGMQRFEKTVAPSEASKGQTEVEKVLGDLKQKLQDRKGGSVEKKTKKQPSPKKKGKENKDAATKRKAKAKSKPQKGAGKASEADTAGTKRQLVEAKNDQSLPPWWNCKAKNLDLFPEDTAKRFSSRCYHFILKKELNKGIDKNAAKLVAQEAHRNALSRWKTFYPEA